MTLRPTDTVTLVRAAQAGDRGALDDLVGSHLPLLYNVIGRALNGHADVDDLVQETLMRVVRGLPALRDPTRFRSWAVAIAYRQVQRHSKAPTRRVRRPPPRRSPRRWPRRRARPSSGGGRPARRGGWY